MDEYPVAATMLTTGVVARELRVCEDTVRRLAARGTLKFVRTQSGLRLHDSRDVERVTRQRAERRQ